MNDRQIECFLTVAKYLNFTKAGEVLYTSQSTVSRQISLLEKELGYPLFHRGNNFVHLTPAGTIMVRTFEQMMTYLKQQKKLALDSNLGQSGRLVVAFLGDMNIDLFYENFLHSFLEKYPNISVEHICILNGSLSESLLDQTVDFVFTHDFDAPESDLFLSETIQHTNMILVYGCKHPLAGKKNLKFEDFKDDIFWTSGLSDTPARLDILKQAAEYYHVGPLKSKSAENQYTAMLNVRLGNGVTLIDPMSFQLSSGYCILPLDKNISRININITWNRKNLNPVLALFTNMFFHLNS